MTSDHIALTINTYNDQAAEYAVKSKKYAPVPEREQFLSMLPPHANILDAGCGPGRDSQFFSSKGSNVTGIDLSERMIELAKKQSPQSDFHVMDVRNITLTDSFDGVWACASLLHLKRSEIPNVLRKFYELINSGGILFLLMKEGKGEIESDRFFTFVSKEEIQKLLKKAGFDVQDIIVWDQKDRNPERPSELWLSCFAKKV